MAINIKVSDQYQGVVETAGSPQSSVVGEAITRVNSLSEIPANANGVYRLPSGELLSYVNGVSVLTEPTAKKFDRPLKTICIGNSIVNGWKISGTAWTAQAEQVYVNQFIDALVYPQIVGTTGVSGSSDIYGVYGASGRTSGEILADLQVALITPMNNAGEVPDLVWFGALFENDIPTGVTLQVMKENAYKLYLLIKLNWPSAICIFAKCRPNNDINTALEKSTFVALNTWLDTFDNGVDIFVYNPGLYYANAGDVTIPDNYTITGSISGTTLTVEDGSKLFIGQAVNDASHYITSANGTNVYGVTTGLTFSSGSSITIGLSTDMVVHPQQYGTGKSVRGATIPLFNRILDSVNVGRIKDVATQNASMSGSTVVSAAANILAGTIPTGITVAGQPNGNVKTTANQPGITVEGTVITPQTTGFQVGQLTMSDMAANTYLPAFILVVKIRLLTGVVNIKQIYPMYRYGENGAGVGSQVQFLLNGSASHGYDYQDGDVLTLTSPLIKSVGVGTLITRIILYLTQQVYEQTPAGQGFTYEVLSASYELPKRLTGIATLVGGTVTVPMGVAVKATSIINFYRKTSGGTVGALLETRTVGQNFVITSTSALDTSTIYWELING